VDYVGPGHGLAKTGEQRRQGACMNRREFISSLQPRRPLLYTPTPSSPISLLSMQPTAQTQHSIQWTRSPPSLSFYPVDASCVVFQGLNQGVQILRVIYCLSFGHRTTHSRCHFPLSVTFRKVGFLTRSDGGYQQEDQQHDIFNQRKDDIEWNIHTYGHPR